MSLYLYYDYDTYKLSKFNPYVRDQKMNLQTNTSIKQYCNLKIPISNNLHNVLIIHHIPDPYNKFITPQYTYKYANITQYYDKQEIMRFVNSIICVFYFEDLININLIEFVHEISQSNICTVCQIYLNCLYNHHYINGKCYKCINNEVDSEVNSDLDDEPYDDDHDF
jgi:hypothetical protein